MGADGGCAQRGWQGLLRCSRPQATQVSRGSGSEATLNRTKKPPCPAAPESGGPVSCTDVGSLPSVAPGILDAQHTRTLISSRDLTGTHVKGQEKDFGPRISDGEAEA